MFFILFLQTIPFLSLAQSGNNNTNSVDTTKTTIWDQSNDFIRKIPSLQILIDSAVSRDPRLNLKQLDVRQKELELAKARKAWTKDIISSSAGVNYGKFDNLVISKDLGIDQLNTRSEAQTRYSVGLSLKFPITTIFDHTEVKLAKIDLERIDYDKRELIKNIREEVYSKYNALIDAYQNYIILAGDFESYDIIAQNAEKDFYRNQMTLPEIINLKISNSKVKMELYNAKNKLQKAIWELHELTGIEIKF